MKKNSSGWVALQAFLRFFPQFWERVAKLIGVACFFNRHPTVWPCSAPYRVYWLDLNEIVESSEPLGVFALVDVDERSDLGGGEGDVVVAQNHLELLAPHAVRARPQVVVFPQNLRILDDSLQLWKIHFTNAKICICVHHNRSRRTKSEKDTSS